MNPSGPNMPNSGVGGLNDLFLKTITDLEVPPPIDATATVMVTRDRMKAYLRLTPSQNGGANLGFAAMEKLLADAGVTYGIRTDMLIRLSKETVQSGEVCVAEGVPSVSGEPASLAYHVALSREAVPRELPDGTVDYKDLGLVENVRRGDPLCTKTPATPGTPGMDVRGQPIPPRPGKDYALPLGKNTKVSENGLVLLAAVDGQADVVNGRVQVLNVITVKQDVDVSTGNINFVGNVVVRGSIRSGYSVRAEGNVTVRGAVEAAMIMAGGNVVISEGFNGMSKGEITCGGALQCKYIQAGKVSTGGDLDTQAILHSVVQCGGSVRMIGPRSAIMGGRVLARESITCTTVGNQKSMMRTHVEVGSDPTILARSHEIPREIESVNKSLSALTQIAELFEKLDSLGRITPDRRVELEKAVTTRRTLQEQLVALDLEKADVAEKIAQVGHGIITVPGTIYPGTRVVIGPEQFIFSSVYPCVRITRGENGLDFAPAR